MSSNLWRSRRRRERPVIYGRDRERAQLREILDDAIAGHGSLVLISGEAGIGKTTLVDDLIHEAEQQGCLVPSGGCYDLTTTPPYGPWGEVIRGYDPPKGGAPFPNWFANPEAMEQMGSQAQLFEEARRFFAEVASRQPLVIVLEDLHWSDPASLDALRYLGRALADAPILTIATYRDDEITRRDPLSLLLPALVREAGAVRLPVTRLDQDGLRDLIEADFNLSAEDTERLARHVAELSEGNPLYAVELLRTVEDEGVINCEDGHHRLGELGDSTVPPLIQQVIERRLNRLDSVVTEALEVAAVIGQEFDFETWEAVGGDQGSVPPEALEIAQGNGIIEELGNSGRYRFRHALVREALYQRQIWPRRRAWHLRVAEVLINQPTPDPDIVSHHFRIAGDERIVDWLIRASQRAERTYAWKTAVERIEEVLTLIVDDPRQNRKRGWLEYRLGCLLRFSDARRALAYFDEAYLAAQSLDDEALSACAEYERGLLRLSAGDFPDGVRQMARGVQALEALPLPDRLRINSGDVFGVEAMPTEFQLDGSAPMRPPPAPIVKNLFRSDLDRRAVLGHHLSITGHLEEAEAHFEPFIRRDGASTLPVDGAGHFFVAGAAVLAGLRGRVKESEELFRMQSRGRGTGWIPAYVIATAANEIDHLLLPYRTDDMVTRERLISLVGGIMQQSVEVMPAGWIPEHQLSFLQIVTGQWSDLIQWTRQADLERGRTFNTQKVRAALAAIALHVGNIDDFHAHCLQVLPLGYDQEPGDVYLPAGLMVQ